MGVYLQKGRGIYKRKGVYRRAFSEYKEEGSIYEWGSLYTRGSSISNEAFYIEAGSNYKEDPNIQRREAGGDIKGPPHTSEIYR